MCTWFVVVNIAWLWTLIKRDYSAVISFHLKKSHDVLWLPYLCCLVVKGQRCAFEITFEENLELEEHSEERLFSICTQ